MKKIVFLITFFHLALVHAQEEKKEEIVAKANQFVALGNDLLVEDGNFPKAEGEYRKAIDKNPVDPTAKYNLANAYYNSKKYDEATQRYTEAVKVADSKLAKHKAFHNKGNTFMEQKKYKEAVEAYKNALRNNPKDDETRYNLALAKKMLEQQKNDGGGGDDDKENKDNKENKEGDNKDDQKKGEDKKEDGDKGENKEDKKEGEDKKDEEGDPKDEKNKDNEGDKMNDEGKPEEQKQPPQQVQGKLSPQQVKNLLEAMNNAEKKVQGKINEKKAQGAKVRSEKDW